MRKFLLITMLALAGCVAKPVAWESTTITYGLDFREYAQQGFLFTTDTYRGEYESLGIVSITLIPEVSKARRNTPNRQWSRAIEPGTGRSWWIEVLDSQSAVAQAHGLAVGMGADALVEFAISEVMVDNGGMEVPTLEVSGFAIKRR